MNTTNIILPMPVKATGTSKVQYTTFAPTQLGVLMGCGVRKKPGEDNFVQKGGMLISSGPENIKDPENIDDRDIWRIPFIGVGLVVKDEYNPEYQFIDEFKGNHAFRLEPDANNSYEYMDGSRLVGRCSI